MTSEHSRAEVDAIYEQMERIEKSRKCCVRCTDYVVRTAFGSSTGTWASGAGDSLIRAVCRATPSEPLEGSNPMSRKELEDMKEKVNGYGSKWLYRNRNCGERTFYHKKMINVDKADKASRRWRKVNTIR